MVVITRNSFRNMCESLSAGSDGEISTRNIAPPWCSSGRVYERRKPRKVSSRELKSSYPLRENIWEYQNDRSRCRIYKKCSKVPPKGNGRLKLKLLILLTITGLSTFYLYSEKPTEDILKLIKKTKILNIINPKPVAVEEECCYRMKYLTTLLSRSEYVLRNAIGSYIAGASVVKGSDTVEWGSRVALWGVVPLWRAAPPPDTVLALRKPTPADCWPFSGSSGNIEIHLPRLTQVASISVEHIRPDTAHSAPKDFAVYGILENGTWIKAADGIYRYNKPAKQYYSLDNRNAPLKRIVFRVLSNHGNPKYTCVYRVHLYSNDFMIYN